MIDNLKQQLLDRVEDLSPEQAEQAANAALDFVRERLPEPLGSKLDDMLEENPDTVQDMATKLTDGLGGLLGG